jgi:hypothetical protein
MRSHVILSMIKVSAAVADVPLLPSSAQQNQISVSHIVFSVLYVYHVSYKAIVDNGKGAIFLIIW